MSTHVEKVHEFIRRKLDASKKTQVEIAKEVGFSKPNVLSMIKAGHTSVPLSRVAALARALDVDPKLLFSMCLVEYKPDLHRAFQEIYGICGTEVNAEVSST